MSLPSPEQLEALGYLRLPPQGDYHVPDKPLAEAQMALRLRIAEAKLAGVRQTVTTFLGHYGNSPLPEFRTAQILAGDILAVTGSGEPQEGSDEKEAGTS